MTTTPDRERFTPQNDRTDGNTIEPMICVITTEADAARAEQLARTLVERRLAGCVSLLPLRSLYIWEGNLEHSDEVQLLIKTIPSQLEALKQAVLDLHSYVTPMWVQWQAQTTTGYGAWLAQLRAPQGAPQPTDADSPETGDRAG
ncbi:MAG: divalent-cation tolerance protein CutA [Synechococcaceae cyanobacterium]